MRNDLQIKVTYGENEKGTRSYLIDFYAYPESIYAGMLVGNIVISARGEIEWHIRNLEYEDELYCYTDYFNGTSDIRKIDYKDDELEFGRWNRVNDFIDNRGLFVNFNQKRYGYTKRYR